MAKRNNNGLLFAALLGGGLYWASKQPGGIKGTFDKYGKKLTQIQNSNDPIGEIKRQLNDAKYAMANNDRPYGTSAFDPTPRV